MKKILMAVIAGLLIAAPASATVSSIKVCDSKTLTASTTTDCAAVEVPASRYFSYQVYCGETTDDNMSVHVDWVGGKDSATMAVPSGVARLKSAYSTEDAWSAVDSISTPLVPYGTIRLTENNGDDDIVCSVILNVSTVPNSLEDAVFQGTATASGGLVVGETLGPELVANPTCDVEASWTLGTGWTIAAGVASHAAGSTSTLQPNPAITTVAGTTYKIVWTITAFPTSTALQWFNATNTYPASPAYATPATGTFTHYFTSGQAAAIVLNANSGVVASVDNISIRAVTSTISPASGPVVLTRTLTDATANETAVHVVSKQTGAGGDKTTLRVESVGSGTGTEYLQEWYADGVLQGYIRNNGTVYLTGALGVVGLLTNYVQTQSCSDGAGVSAKTISVTSSYIEITNLDVDGCDITMAEGVAVGSVVTLCVVANAGTTVNFADTAGVTELAGAFAANIDDCITLRYGNTTTWREVSRSAN